MDVKYFDVVVDWHGEVYTMVYPARSKEAAREKAIDEINDAWQVSESKFDEIAKITLRKTPPDTQYKYVKNYYNVAPVIGQEFTYNAMGEDYKATVVAPTHEEVASVFFIKDGYDHVMRMHPNSFKDALQAA